MIICAYCGRKRADTLDQNRDKGDSHGICPKCAIVDERPRVFPVDELSDDDIRFFKDSIKKEIKNGTVWLGSDKKYTDEEGLQLYNRLLSEAQTELESERTQEIKMK